MTDSPPKQEPPYGLRMPPDLKDRVKAAAKRNNRSMNAEIVAALEEKFPVPTISQYLADKLGAESILEFINTDKADLPAAIHKMNKRMEQDGISMRFVMRKGKVELVAIGELWTEDMAIESEGRKE